MDMLHHTVVFQDRADAGGQLAERLEGFRDQSPIVIGLPRGGVAVAYEIARALHAPLDVLVARKLGAPGHEELGIGAIAPGGVRVLDEMSIRWLGITQAQIDQIVAEQTAEMERRLRLYRGDQPLPEFRGRTVILADDGLATGVTARAAIRALRQAEVGRLVLAVPVCAPETAALVRPEVDDFICLATPGEFHAVGLWYRDFSQLTDQQVIDLLERARRETAPQGGEMR